MNTNECRGREGGERSNTRKWKKEEEAEGTRRTGVGCIRKKVAEQEERTQKKMKSWVQNFLKNKQG